MYFLLLLKTHKHDRNNLILKFQQHAYSAVTLFTLLIFFSPFLGARNDKKFHFLSFFFMPSWSWTDHNFVNYLLSRQRQSTQLYTYVPNTYNLYVIWKNGTEVLLERGSLRQAWKR